MTLDRRINAPDSAASRRKRREFKSKDILVPAIIGKGDNSLPITSDGNIWVRRTASKGKNGDIQYGLPELVSVGVADYWIDNNTKVFIKKDPYYGQWEVSRADLQDAKAKKRNAAQLNSGNPQNKYFRLKNASRLLCRPVGGNPGTSTLVGVRGLLYHDNYRDLSHRSATGLVSAKLDLASYIPTAGNHAVVAVWLDTFNNTLHATSSTAQATTTELDLTDYQEAIDAGHTDYIPIQAFHLGDAQTNINNTHLGEDLRQFVNMPPAIGNEYELTIDTRIHNKRQYLVAGTLTVPSGKTLTIESGGQLVVLGSATRHSYQTETTTYNMTGDEDIIKADATSAAFAVNLPAVADVDGQEYTIIKTDSSSNVVTLDPSGSETINGVTTKGLLAQWSAANILATDTGWIIK